MQFIEFIAHLHKKNINKKLPTRLNYFERKVNFITYYQEMTSPNFIGYFLLMYFIIKSF